MRPFRRHERKEVRVDLEGAALITGRIDGTWTGESDKLKSFDRLSGFLQV
jgi:hypothetical protein